jgi:hypothetical protein
MLAAHLDTVLADFTHRRIPFSHRDVAAGIPDVPACALALVLRYVYQWMQRVPSYRMSVAYFVGEGVTLMCYPREIGSGPALPEMPVMAGSQRVS